MNRTGEQGYILASTLVVLLAIGMVASALLGASGDALSRLKRAEADARRDALLESALVIIGSQLPVEPRRRQIDLEGDIALDVFGQPVAARIAWEARKLDLNAADPAALARLLAAHEVPEGTSQKIMAFIREGRAAKTPVRFLADIGLQRAEEDCIAALVTVFGGLAGFDPAMIDEPAPVGRPAVGSRLTVSLALRGHEQDGLAASILVSGKPSEPYRVLDWRPTSSLAGDPCDAA